MRFLQPNLIKSPPRPGKRSSSSQMRVLGCGRGGVLCGEGCYDRYVIRLFELWAFTEIGV